MSGLQNNTIDMKTLMEMRAKGLGWEDICVHLGYLPLDCKAARFVRTMVLKKIGLRAA